MDTHLARQLPNDIIIRIIREATVMGTMDYWMDLHSRIDPRDRASSSPGLRSPQAPFHCGDTARTPAQEIYEAIGMSSEYPWFCGDVWDLEPLCHCAGVGSAMCAGPHWTATLNGKPLPEEYGEHPAQGVTGMLWEDGDEIALDLKFE